MEKVTFDTAKFATSRPAPELGVKKKRKPNPRFELAAFAALRYNMAKPDKVVTAMRFLRDATMNEKAYELAQLDYEELKHLCSDGKEQAKLFFGQLKKRKNQE